MATLTWIGTTADASDLSNWSPEQLPASGDDLEMPTGSTMDIQGDVLAGDTLLIGRSVSNGQQPAVLNVSGRADFTVQGNFPPYGVSSTTINLADHSTWIGGFSTAFVPVFIHGDGVFANTATKILGGTSVIDATIKGHGTISVSSAQSIGGSLEVTKAVSSGESFSVVGDPERGLSSTLIVDDPKDFHGSISMGRAEVTLKDLAADNYSITGDMLRLYEGNKLVEKLSLTLRPEATGFGVSQVGGDINIHANGSQPGIPLPTHGSA